MPPPISQNPSKIPISCTKMHKFPNNPFAAPTPKPAATTPAPAAVAGNSNNVASINPGPPSPDEARTPKIAPKINFFTSRDDLGRPKLQLRVRCPINNWSAAAFLWSGLSVCHAGTHPGAFGCGYAALYYYRVIPSPPATILAVGQTIVFRGLPRNWLLSWSRRFPLPAPCRDRPPPMRAGPRLARMAAPATSATPPKAPSPT